MKINFAVPNYREWTILRGGALHDQPACHALMHYAISARQIYDMHLNPGRVREYEGVTNQTTNPRELFKSIALIHGVEPGEMLHFWSVVDAQFRLLDIPPVPFAYDLRQTN